MCKASDKDAGVRTFHHVQWNSGIFQCLVRYLQLNSLLGIHRFRLDVRYLEEVRIKCSHILGQEMTTSVAVCYIRLSTSMEERFPVITFGRNVGPDIASCLKNLPKALKIMCTAREATTDANNGNGYRSHA